MVSAPVDDLPAALMHEVCVSEAVAEREPVKMM